MIGLDISTISGYLIRLGIAILLGLLIGFERQYEGHTVKITTNVTVCVGAFIFASFGYLVNDANVDLTRIAAQIVCGVGFISGGVIMRDGFDVKGLNTAATVWATAAIGVLCCCDNILFAVFAALSITALNLMLHPISKYINKKRYKNKNNLNEECFYKITVICNEDDVRNIKKYTTDFIKENPDVLLKRLESEETPDDKIKIKAYLSTIKMDDSTIEYITANISTTHGVKSIGWKQIDDLN